MERKLTGEITLESGPFGSYVVCAVFDSGSGDWDETDPEYSALIQTDYDRPPVAATFGWVPEGGCDGGCRGTDGTVGCPACGTATGHYIESATEFLDGIAGYGIRVPDPGYFG